MASFGRRRPSSAHSATNLASSVPELAVYGRVSQVWPEIRPIGRCPLKTKFGRAMLNGVGPSQGKIGLHSENLNGPRSGTLLEQLRVDVEADGPKADTDRDGDQHKHARVSLFWLEHCLPTNINDTKSANIVGISRRANDESTCLRHLSASAVASTSPFSPNRPSDRHLADTCRRLEVAGFAPGGMQSTFWPHGVSQHCAVSSIDRPGQFARKSTLWA